MRRVVIGGLCAALIGFISTALAEDTTTRGATGPSTTTLPYLQPLAPGVSFVSLLAAGDPVGEKPDGAPWRMVGVPDGLGAFDNGDGSITVLMDHELPPKAGLVRRHGFAGAFVSKLVIDKATLRVTRASDLIEQAFEYDAAGGRYVPLASPLGKLCSADLAGGTAFYDAASGLGYDGRIFMSGEEHDPEGRPFAHFVTGPEAGKSYELAWLGNMAFENLLAHPRGGRRTIVGVMEDSHPKGEVYFYVGEKRAAGDAVARAGLSHGRLFGLKIERMPSESADLEPLGPEKAARFTLADLGDASALSGQEIEKRRKQEGVTAFLRPEDGAWDTLDPNRFYFNTTAAFDAPSRLWAVDFDDFSQPEKGGTIRILLRGDEGQHMLDNMAIARNGQVLLQEDPGEGAYLARVYQYDPRKNELVALAQHDPALFGKKGALSMDEESSGVIDVTPLLGGPRQRAFLLSVQPHAGFLREGKKDEEIVQGGQLLLMRQEAP
ncbi:hypothetical protein ACNHKD_04930 [Methylocystis sp. JAN1]|uniref:hypothetical protein n=1 Tax=Methylocystis sp. JAN1 TaxID=3397211 RepID=UPI003FA256F9